MEQLDLLTACEEVLEILVNSSPMSISRLLQNRNEIEDQKILQSAIYSLEAEGYILRHSKELLFITTKGSLLIEMGGYKEKMKQDRLKEKYIEELNGSVLKTNNSVIETNSFTIQNSKNQTRLTWISIIVAVSAVLVAAIPLFNSQGGEIKRLEQVIEKQNAILDRIHKELNFSKQPASANLNENLRKPSGR